MDQHLLELLDPGPRLEIAMQFEKVHLEIFKKIGII